MITIELVSTVLALIKQSSPQSTTLFPPKSVLSWLKIIIILIRLEFEGIYEG